MTAPTELELDQLASYLGDRAAATILTYVAEDTLAGIPDRTNVTDLEAHRARRHPTRQDPPA